MITMLSNLLKCISSYKNHLSNLFNERGNLRRVFLVGGTLRCHRLSVFKLIKKFFYEPMYFSNVSHHLRAETCNLTCCGPSTSLSRGGKGTCLASSMFLGVTNIT